MQNSNDISISIERIKQMERLYDNVNDALSDNPASIHKSKALKTAIIILEDYYSKGLWLHDYSLDEDGFLPPELKRGVLSQDALYNLFCEIESLKKGGD
ncbi:MAG: DUF4298 domain-containing protein [Oscillospiraceae bacterium]|nr:DUF4298 domain-containing protein [Oscillospiraceae bacterium]